ncbi:MAG: universal stress protein [Mangrovicoccus sp.]|nr:universal stress protein [Mangrovicoccus sp.]
MTYRSILTVARHHDADKAHLDAAADLAAQLDAHLDVLCLGVDEIQMGYFFTGTDAMMLQKTLEQAREASEQVLAAVEAQLAGRALRWSCRSLVSQIGALTEVIAAQARYVDLVVLPQPYGEDRNSEDEVILEAALLATNTPVLVLPEGFALPAPFPGPAMIGWNGGNQALRATRAALPFLAMAGSVDVVVVDPPRRSPSQAQPGLELSKMLDRHGITTTLKELPAGHQPIAKVLLDHAKSRQCGLIISGAYGHSRFREAVLGGATRELLTHAKVPILMTH